MDEVNPPTKSTIEVHLRFPFFIKWMNSQGYEVVRSFPTKEVLEQYVELLPD